jgi:hypothetical protein
MLLLYIGSAVIIWLVGMLLLFVYWECCYLGSGNAVVNCMQLLIVHWELICYLCIGNVVVCVLGMVLLFVYWE